MASILLTGGARSGKSRFATEMAAARGERVLFVATATAGDDEMRRRIAKHQQERPAAWRTLETPLQVGEQTAAALDDAEVVIIDCLTLLLNNILGGCTGEDGQIDEAAAERALAEEVAALKKCIGGSEATFIIVTNEVGLGIVPANALSRLYRDLLGKANQQISAIVDEVYLLVAGQPLRIKPN